MVLDYDLLVDCNFYWLYTCEHSIIGSWESWHTPMLVRDFLPEDITNVPKYIHGYCAELQCDTWRNVILDYAREIRLSYDTVYPNRLQSSKASTRSAIRIAHILGGFIIKTAIRDLSRINHVKSHHAGLVRLVAPNSPTISNLNEPFARVAKIPSRHFNIPLLTV